MSLISRHTTIVLIIIISILIIIDSFVVIRFFTDDKLEEITFSQASLNNYENIISSKVSELSKPETIVFKNSKDTNRNTNESKIDKTLINLKESVQTKNNDAIIISTNDNENIPNIPKEDEEVDIPMQISKVQIPTSRSSEPRKTINPSSENVSEQPHTESHVEEQQKVQAQAQPEPTPISSTSSISANQTSIGTIEIPKTGVSLPILQKVSVSGMEVATCYLYSTGAININGTTIIVGHNYCNGKLFSNNKKLQIGDKIYITANGIKKEYTVYDKFITTEEDISYLDRNTSNEPQIALSTCTDNEEKRLVILAK